MTLSFTKTLLGAAAAALLLVPLAAGADTPAAAGADALASYHSSDLQLCVDPAEAEAVLAPTMGDCCRVNVKGCGEKAQICVPGDCDSSNKKKARASFEDKYDCKGNSVSGYAGDSCSSNKCDWSL